MKTDAGIYLSIGVALSGLTLVLGMSSQSTTARGGVAEVPEFRVDPFWPKPLPEVRDDEGNLHGWITGEVGGTCADSHDHIFTLNRAWQNSSLGKMANFEGFSGIPAPPVVVYDTEGNVVDSWGDTSLLEPGGGTKVMPESFHGCFVDYQDNVWISGNGDGIVQKYTHDGTFLMQIGEKGVCDGDPPAPGQTIVGFFPTCRSPGKNASKTLLNSPADIAVDPDPDPVTGERGSVYIADGYGNHRIVVFDAAGNYLRQWGSPGDGPGQFSETGGGHPHCVVIGNDDLVYVCDRGNSRIQIFDKAGDLNRIIPIEPDGFSTTAHVRTNDIEFSPDRAQAFLYTSDVSAGKIWILDRSMGEIVKGFGRMGHMAGEFVGVHTLAVDSDGNLYAAEGGGGRRVQKFIRQ